MSTLITRIQDLATRVATEFKSVRTLINGNQASLSSLTTANNTTLVSAINELRANTQYLGTLAANAAGINDGAIANTSTWSSNNINTKIVTVNTAVTTLTSNVGNLNTTVSNQTANIATLFNNTSVLTTNVSTLFSNVSVLTTNVATLFSNVSTLNTSLATKATINDGVTNTSVTWSSNNINNQIALQVTAGIASVVNAAPTALDTLVEIAAQLATDESVTSGLVTSVGNRVRVDVANQSLTALQQSNARTNIAALSTVEVGTPDTDFTVTFNAGLL